MKNGTCPRCLREDVELTRDHIIPKWFVNKIPNFDLSVKEFSHNKTIPPTSLKELICKRCNSDKGGRIEYNHPVVITFISDFVEALSKKVKAYEKKSTDSS